MLWHPAQREDDRGEANWRSDTDTQVVASFCFFSDDRAISHKDGPGLSFRSHHREAITQRCLIIHHHYRCIDMMMEKTGAPQNQTINKLEHGNRVKEGLIQLRGRSNKYNYHPIYRLKNSSEPLYSHKPSHVTFPRAPSVSASLS